MIADQIPDKFWPQEEQQLLLKAALYQGKDCERSFNDWINSVDVDKIEPSSMRLIPLLYKNLVSNRVDHPLITRFKGIYKLNWYKNQMLLRQLQRLIPTFESENTNILLMKGMALSLLYYKDLGVRPMQDIDVLIPVKRAPNSINYLVNNGWEPIERSFLSSSIPSHSYFQSLHSDGFKNSKGEEIDLHWHVLAECCYDEADEFFWRGSVSFNNHQLNTRTLNASDHLVHTCVHAFRWDAVTTLRWIPDAITILQTSYDQIDWERVVTIAKKFRLIIQIRSALDYLANMFNAPIPKVVHQNLALLSTTRLELKENKVRMQNRSIVGDWIADYYRFRTYSRIPNNKKSMLKMLYLPLFFKNVWGITSWWKLPLILIGKITNRLGIIFSKKSKNDQ